MPDGVLICQQPEDKTEMDDTLIELTEPLRRDRSRAAPGEHVGTFSRGSGPSRSGGPEEDLTLVDLARRKLEAKFVTLDLKPGSVWTESSLSELLGIGRTPVREAIARMAVDGLVTVI